MNIKDKLKQEVAAAIARCSKLSLDECLSSLSQPKNSKHGDLTFPCFKLAKNWSIDSALCAERLAKEIRLPESIKETRPIGAFLNFSFSRELIFTEVINNILSGESSVDNKKQTVVIEYSSPNIAKPFHVGHLRATLIGNCLDKVHRALGNKTISINHLGDWGTQFGFVWAGCKLFGFPPTPSVSNLVELYRKANELKEEQLKNGVNGDTQLVDEIARAFFIDLEAGVDYAVKFWKQCVQISLEYLKATYNRLGISFDHYIGESFYSDKLKDVQTELENSGLLSESQGALGVDLGEQLGFARIFTPDGRSLYLTRDIATAGYRYERFKFDKSIYVVGAPQTLHFQQLKGILKALNKSYAEHMIHVAFGHVLGMKTRGGGNFIELNEFLDDATNVALSAYQNQVSKRPEGLDEQYVAERVALSAVIFSNLSRSNIKDVHFKLEQALEFQGDTGPYLLYACARINGIKEKAKEAGLGIQTNPKFELLTEDSAYNLVLSLLKFEEVLTQTASNNEPYHTANYALDVAKAFSRAYLELRVIGEEKNKAQARLCLFEASRLVLSKCLRLLGIEPLDRM